MRRDIQEEESKGFEGGPVWEPHVQELRKFTRSFSTGNVTKVVPLHLERVSTTLEDVRRNSESLMLSAHSTIQKLALPSEGLLSSEPRKIEPLSIKVKDASSSKKSLKKDQGVGRAGRVGRGNRRSVRRVVSDNSLA